VEARGLAAPRGSGEDDEPLGRRGRGRQAALHLLRHAEVGEGGDGVLHRQQAEHRALAAGGGQDRDADRHRPVRRRKVERTVLREQALAQGEAGQGLHPADDPAHQPGRRAHPLREDAIDPEAHPGRARIGLDVDVARALGEGRLEGQLEEARRRRRL
jgi:hypothetical protein